MSISIVALRMSPVMLLITTPPLIALFSLKPLLCIARSTASCATFAYAVSAL